MGYLHLGTIDSKKKTLESPQSNASLPDLDQIFPHLTTTDIRSVALAHAGDGDLQVVDQLVVALDALVFGVMVTVLDLPALLQDFRVLAFIEEAPWLGGICRRCIRICPRPPKGRHLSPEGGIQGGIFLARPPFNNTTPGIAKKIRIRIWSTIRHPNDSQRNLQHRPSITTPRPSKNPLTISAELAGDSSFPLGSTMVPGADGAAASTSSCCLPKSASLATERRSYHERYLVAYFSPGKVFLRETMLGRKMRVYIFCAYLR